MSNVLSGEGKRRLKESLVEKLKGDGTSVQEEEPTLDTSPSESNDVDKSDALNVKKEFNKGDKTERYLHGRLGDFNKQKQLRRDVSYLEDKAERYGWGKLSKAEKDELRLKRDLLNLYGQKRREELHHFQISNDGTRDGRNSRTLAPTSRYGNKYREESWEKHQLKYAVLQENVDEIRVPDSQKYEYIFDEDAAIAFSNDSADLLPEEELGDSDGDDQSKDTQNDAENTQEKYLLEQLGKEENRIAAVQKTRTQLPVYHYRQQLLDAIRKDQILIIVGETGSGKTTQLPQYLIEDGYTKEGAYQIVVTQPRRVAATSVASRVSDEMNVVLGEEVGYSIRFDDRTKPGKTVLKYVTDGILLQEFLTDPQLSRYSCVMIDEAHERTLATDILLGLLKKLLAERLDLKLLISSATVNSKQFSQFFDNCPIITIPGRRYPVDIHYTLQPEGNYVTAAITTVFQIHTTQPLPGDILVFLTGQEEIERTREKIEYIAEKLGSRMPQLLITPIYANLPQEQQLRIFQPTPKDCRKVVLATNIAETSLTIDNIKYVIDSGYVKENSFVPSTGMTQLLTVPCSKASVDQRAGRAGRTGYGKCFRLFTKWSYENELEQMPRPEILRTSLSNAVLLLLSLGVTDLLNFPFLDRPSIPALTKSLENLYILGALNSKGQITKLGRLLCDFPCEPEFAKVLHSAGANDKCNGVLDECLSIVAMLHETSSLFVGNKEEAVKRVVSEVSSDHMLYLTIYEQWRESNYSKIWCRDHKIQYKTMNRVKNIRQQLYRSCVKWKLTEANKEAKSKLHDGVSGGNLSVRITKAFITGFPTNIAELGMNGYRTIGKAKGGINVAVHPSSVVSQNYREGGTKPSKFILYQQLVLTSKEFIRDCVPVPHEGWLAEMVPQIFRHLVRNV